MPKPVFFVAFQGCEGPGPISGPSPGLEVQSPRQKCVISMRICRVAAIFVVIEKFGTLLLVLKLNSQAVREAALAADWITA